MPQTFKLPLDYDYKQLRNVWMSDSASLQPMVFVAKGKVRKGTMPEPCSRAVFMASDRPYGVRTVRMEKYRYVAVPSEGYPRELALYTYNNKVAVATNVVADVRELRKDTMNLMSFNVRKRMGVDGVLTSRKGHFEIEVELTPKPLTGELAGGKALSAAVNLNNATGDSCKVEVDFAKHSLSVYNRRRCLVTASLESLEGDSYPLDIFVNGSRIEVIADEKVSVMAHITQTEPFANVHFTAEGVKTKFSGFNVYALRDETLSPRFSK